MKTLTFDADGTVRFIYDDAVAQLVREEFEAPHVERASHVEPSGEGWAAEIIGGPTLGPFLHRHEALTAEVAWLKRVRGL